MQIYPIRAVLEGLAARDAATRIDAAGLKRLEKLIDLDAQVRGARRHARGRRRRLRVSSDGRRNVGQLAAEAVLGTDAAGDHDVPHRVAFASPAGGDRRTAHAGARGAARRATPDAAERAMRRHIEEPGNGCRQALEEPADHGRPRSPSGPAARTRKPRPARHAGSRAAGAAPAPLARDSPRIIDSRLTRPRHARDGSEVTRGHAI